MCVFHSLEVCGDFLVPVVIIIPVRLDSCLCTVFDRAFLQATPFARVSEGARACLRVRASVGVFTVQGEPRPDAT